MKATELRQKSSTELKTLLLEQSKEKFKLRLQGSVGENPKPHFGRNIRRFIARIHTVMKQKERQL